MRTINQLTLEDVAKIVDACRKKAKELGEDATIAVVDASGSLLFLERPDFHSVNTVEMSIGKARTAAYRGRPSSALEQRVKERPGFLMTPNQIGVRGGMPIFYKGQLVGGVGASGVGENDENVAQAGAAAFE